MRTEIQFFLLLLFFSSCTPEGQKDQVKDISGTQLIDYDVIMTLEHDPQAFTQGIVIHNGVIYESTGGSDSWIARYDIDHGTYERKVTLDKRYFGEGITVLNNKLYQLTWKSKVGFIYDLGTFKKAGEFNYPFEGWGLTTDGVDLIISDGTEKLYFMDTVSFAIKKTLSIMQGDAKTSKLNELEYIDGYVYANQLDINKIFKIDIEKAEVVSEISLDRLVNAVKQYDSNAEVLNGIGYDEQTGRILITGKLWPRSYLIRLKDDKK